MSGVDLESLIFIGVSLLLSAFFSSSETAYFSLQKTRIAHLVNTDVPGARRVARMIEEPERLLSTILLGNNLVNIAFAAIITVTVASLLSDDQAGTAILVATAIGTTIILVFGEILPKSVAFRNSERVAFMFARPLKFIEILLLPLVVILQWIGRSTNSAFSDNSSAPTPFVTEDEFRTLIDVGEAEGSLDPEEAEMLESVFRFGDKQVREVMSPRTEIISIERGATLGGFLAVYENSPHTRFPVFKGTPDNLVGILSSKDILKAMCSRDIPHSEPITDRIRDAYFVPETKRIAELFDELRRTGNQLALAVDEFGGISGLVTLKRLLEEVAGRVGEEGVSPEEEFIALGQNIYELDGAMSIEQANDELDINLPEGDFETVAGFVLDNLGHIPTVGEIVEFGNMKLEVSRMKEMKIDSVKLNKRLS
ncbi:MAG: hemolysin family protein [SAR202 cluster bacterium]|jgi:putative hemolysin|nr:hemolysin family protein [SAR202 cluster bacterium]